MKKKTNKKAPQPKSKNTNKVVYLSIIIGIISIVVWGFISLGKPQIWSDPFAYCASINSIDTPDWRYTGDKMPQVIVDGLRQVLNVSTGMPNDLFIGGSSWRCMDGGVYACNIGANLPCEAKANIDKNPTEAEKDFCIQNPDTDIPAAVTGHETIFAWRCDNGSPTIDEQIFQVDARGYISEIWYKINPTKN